MSEMRSDASLRGKVRHLAKEHDLKPQEVLQMYLFEHLLMRLANSPYADKFVLKGGLLISSMTGIYQRTTMDMDATVLAWIWTRTAWRGPCLRSALVEHHASRMGFVPLGLLIRERGHA